MNNSMHDDYRLKKADVILGAALLVLGLGSFAVLARMPAGRTAFVSVEGEPFGRYDLQTDCVVQIDTAYGHNTLEIKDGQARVTGADCPGGDCMSFGAISRCGQAILCVPHKLSVTIEGPSEYDVLTP